jgi:hypothetical protein
MSGVLTIGDVIQHIAVRRGVDIPPQRLSDLFYRRKLNATRCPVVGGVRRIPADYVPVIEQVLEQRGFLPEREVAGAS